MPKTLRIEHPALGEDYRLDWYGVYEYSAYPADGPLAGQARRICRGIYPELGKAQAAFPAVEWSGPEQGGRADRQPWDTPPTWLDPDVAIEVWEGGQAGE